MLIVSTSINIIVYHNKKNTNIFLLLRYIFFQWFRNNDFITLAIRTDHFYLNWVD